MDDRLKKVIAHVDSCSTCSAANKRVNDFCRDGQLLFFEYAKHAKPIRAEQVTLPQDQYDRLVAETERARRSGEKN